MRNHETLQIIPPPSPHQIPSSTQAVGQLTPPWKFVRLSHKLQNYRTGAEEEMRRGGSQKMADSRSWEYFNAIYYLKD